MLYSRENRTRFAVLGAIAAHPSCGAEIKRYMRETFGDFWAENDGQIYPTLRQLDADGLIELRNDWRSNAVTYSITAKGREVLSEWIALPVEEPGQRVEILLKLSLVDHAPEGAARAHLEQFRSRHECVHRRSELLLKLHADLDNPAPGYRSLLLSLTYLHRMSAAMLDWAEDAERLLAGASASHPEADVRPPQPWAVRVA